MPASRARLLVVEDDAGIRSLLADRLTQFELVFATCQDECFEHLRSPDFDLVLLDLRLPRAAHDMRSSNDVGVDILKQIRSRSLTKRGSTMSLPVVVMTAHGSETLSVSVLVDHGANDYMPKPFGPDQELEHKLARALEGTAALLPASDHATASTASSNRRAVQASVQLSFHPKEPLVLVESIEYRGAHFELLDQLRALYLRDQSGLLRFDEYRGMRAAELAAALGISDKALRQRIVKFRRDVTRDFEQKLERVLGKNDIVQNERDWDGYRLNPRVVRIVRWSGRS